jgi:hypothetical protein
MGDWMGYVIERMRQRAFRRVGELAAALVEAPSEDKEAILAEMEFEQWRAEYCDVCQEND